jgi:hypothetical protein
MGLAQLHSIITQASVERNLSPFSAAFLVEETTAGVG